MMKAVYLALAFAGSSCGCVHGEGEAIAETAPKTPGATPVVKKQVAGRVAGNWQQTMFTKLADDPAGYQQAWGLFSEGGWANAGQVMIYGDATQTKLHAVIVQPEGNKVSADKELSTADFAPIATEAKAAAKLSDLDVVAFDALTFEYVHAVKDASGKVSTEKRVFIRNTGKKNTEAYDALIAAFQKLRQAKN